MTKNVTGYCRCASNIINFCKVLVPMRRMGTLPCLRGRHLQTTD